MMKKYNKLFALLAAVSIMFTSAAPAFAAEQESISEKETLTEKTSEETSAEDSMDVSVCASYYKTDSEKQYKLIFTTLTDIPEFTEMSCTFSFTGAEVKSYDILADYTKKSVTDSTTEITFKLERNSAAVSKAGQLFSIVIDGAAAVPSSDIVAVKDFSIVTSDKKTINITTALTFKEGDVIPELNTDEKKIYDTVTAILKEFSEPAKISYYQTDSDGKESLASLSGYIKQVKEAKDAYESLQNKDNVDKVLEFYGFNAANLDKISSTLGRMYDCRGLIELGFLIKNLDESNILNYQFVFDVYDTKKNLSLSGLEDTLAYTQLQDTLSDYNTKKTVLDSVLNDKNIDYENLVYSCDKQISAIQNISEYVYYTDCLDAVKLSLDKVYNIVDKNYTGKAETKKYLLSCIDGYKEKIALIENGIDDIPTMTVDLVTYQLSYNITFKRQKTLPDSLKSSLLVEVTDKNGNLIDEATTDFASNLTTRKVGMYAERNKYPEGEKITIKGYYILENAKILVDTQTITVAQTATANRPGGIGKGSGSSSSGNTSSDNNTNGGTQFPSNQGKDDNNNNNDNEPEQELFTDISGYSWAKEAIEGLYYAGIVNGMEDGIFNPKGAVTREQFSKMVVQLFGISTSAVSNTGFVDVKTDAWYAPYVAAASQAGYIQGQSNEYFGIGESIMRQDMATILYRALGSRGKRAELSFSDNDSIAPYAKDAVAELVGLGIISGYEDGTFLPRGTATRAEAAKMIWGVYQLIKD